MSTDSCRLTEPGLKQLSLHIVSFSPFSYVYPTFDELGAQLLFVMTHFNLKSIIGLGVGAGANILARFALANPDKVS